MTDFDSIFAQWEDAATSGSLLTLKHDPNDTSDKYFKFKTVLSSQMSSSLERVISERDFLKVERYVDLSKNGAEFYAVIPKKFDVVGFSRFSGSMVDAEPYDQLKVYSGSDQGWHLCAVTSSNIQDLKSSGDITLVDTWTMKSTTP